MTAARGLGRAAAKLSRSLSVATAKARAAELARTLRAEYEAGKAEVDAEAAAAAGGTGPDATDADAEAVAQAIRGVDWSKVRAATTEKGNEAAQAMKSMAAEVDWDRVQPVAAKVSSALIAAVASGQLGIGGRFAAPVARAIMNDRNLAQRVGASMTGNDTESSLPDFRPAVRGAIETTASE